jgi:5-formyltetrahydrofolate cyclo-ligase
VVKANPDAPQLPSGHALADGKLVYMAVPRLAEERPFILLERLDVPPRAPSPSPGRRAAGRQGRRLLGPGVRPSGRGRPDRQGPGAGHHRHPLQVLAEVLPETDHDFRLDLIVTGEEVIACRLTRRPPGILWEHLDAAKIATVPALIARARPATIKP